MAGKKQAASSKHEFEFFGPHGPGLLVLVLPVVLYALIYACNSQGCLQVWPSISVSGWPAGSQIFTVDALIAYVGWFAALTILHLVLPGKHNQGIVLPNGKRLSYKLNAFTLFVITYGGAVYLGFFTNYLDLGWLYDNYLPLLTASVIFSTLLSVYLYATSFKRGALLSAHGDTGYPHYDFWMGRELNPRIGSFDLKEFCELYPGIIGWALLNLAMMHKQRTHLGYITNSMMLTNAFQLYYVVDALWNEAAILTTMDITSDGFGYMLAFGDLSWVPFGFTTAARYLVDYPQDLSLPTVLLILSVKALGYYIFRGANNQKDTFRRNPEDPAVRHLKTLQTAVALASLSAAGGACPATSTTWGTGSWVLPGACRAACLACLPSSPTSTACTSPPCSSTGRGGTTWPAATSTARTGTSTAAWCPGASYPMCTRVGAWRIIPYLYWGGALAHHTLCALAAEFGPQE
eukprot:CAMPEP_0202893210 /NCGR_PEP_ID=MMETSP1392-20130828/2832_1 /ASSEMBLY_ACC=CAM_ASM_000868 /TAXON_ID=225041 /ORGANISM="Chlamydomonas chlamydogama, Strain SAG 11-48b" /LENGTH=461 /DNA_ID=CAMNT_0049577463 /DNA_START=21 /DNA_END=1407 /DNA_ORIENTATION=-